MATQRVLTSIILVLLLWWPAVVEGQGFRASVGWVEHPAAGTNGAVRFAYDWGSRGEWQPMAAAEAPLSGCLSECTGNVPFYAGAGVIRRLHSSRTTDLIVLGTIGPTYPLGATAALGVGLDFRNTGIPVLDDVGLEVQQRLHYDGDAEETHRLTAVFISLLIGGATSE